MFFFDRQTIMIILLEYQRYQNIQIKLEATQMVPRKPQVGQARNHCLARKLTVRCNIQLTLSPQLLTEAYTKIAGPMIVMSAETLLQLPKPRPK